MLESNQRKGETEVTDRKAKLEHVISTMENLEVDVSDVKGKVGEMRPLPQANLQAESSKGKHLRLLYTFRGVSCPSEVAHPV